jgi:hypothetical protein
MKLTRSFRNRSVDPWNKKQSYAGSRLVVPEEFNCARLPRDAGEESCILSRLGEVFITALREDGVRSYQKETMSVCIRN